ncbi:MAG: energy transducer TonB [Pseudomonadota bacterium]
MKTFPLLALMAFVVAAHASEPQPAPPRLTPANRAISLEDLDYGLANFRKTIWLLPANAGNPRPDHTGATMEGDLAKYLLSDATMAKYDALRIRARDAIPAGSKLIPAEAMGPLSEVISGETCRLMVISGYWQSRRAGTYHDDLVQRQIDRLPAPSRPDAAARLRALGERINKLRNTLETDITACPVPPRSEEFVSIVKDYNALRLQALATVLANQTSPAVVSTKRSTTCPSPSPPGTDGARMRVVSRKNLEGFYPPEAVSFQVEGRVEIVIVYDATGCVVETAIQRSSGSDALDKAASEYGFGIVLQPAVVNGNPVRGAAVQPVVFSMRDWPTAFPVPQPQP